MHLEPRSGRTLAVILPRTPLIILIQMYFGILKLVMVGNLERIIKLWLIRCRRTEVGQ
jgi:hypothetical protein